MSALPGNDKPGKSLGLLAWSPEGDGRISVLVTNDTTPNELLSLNDNHDTPANAGYASGLAVSGMGKAEGCMGIAAGDADGDGYLDLLITNFYNESNTFYRSVGGKTFQDTTNEINLEESSLPKLGFGTQFLDANLNGQLELFVANGHVDDLRRQNKPYQMTAQFLRKNRGRYEEVVTPVPGKYFETPRLGRAATLLDWNLDGRPDMAVGHLYDPYSLLTNSSDKDGSYLCIQLIGSHSARDAVGATVTVETADRTQVRQLTSGDGYHGNNQRKLMFGCGRSSIADVVRVTWPSGVSTELSNVATGQTCVIREGTTQVFPLP